MNILGVVTSPRCSKISKEKLYEIVRSENIFDKIYEIAYEGNVSNSESLLLASMWGAREEGANVEIMYPGDEIPEFDGVVLSTPVYFGDRSSSLHDFINNAKLENKAVGVVSCGAKRNGGQETTNIYALYSCLDKRSLITGNGPPTAQYGGTGWAGNKIAIANDYFGIKTSLGTGKCVAKLTKLISAKESERKPKICFLKVTEDLIDLSILNKFTNSDINLIDLTEKNIQKCVGCPICPNGDLSKDYKCIIKNDDMIEVRRAMSESDCVVFISGTNDKKFQVFIERTRFIRRNHFELGEHVYSSISNTESVTDILPLRVMTNMLRHNMFGLPFYKNLFGYTNIDIDQYVKLIEKYTRKSISIREMTGVDHEYTAVGYEDAKINEKAYRD